MALTLTSDHGVVTCCEKTYDLMASENENNGGTALRLHIEAAHWVPYTKAREALAALRRDYATVRTVVI